MILFPVDRNGKRIHVGSELFSDGGAHRIKIESYSWNADRECFDAEFIQISGDPISIDCAHLSTCAELTRWTLGETLPGFVGYLERSARTAEQEAALTQYLEWAYEGHDLPTNEELDEVAREWTTGDLCRDVPVSPVGPMDACCMLPKNHPGPHRNASDVWSNNSPIKWSGRVVLPMGSFELRKPASYDARLRELAAVVVKVAREHNCGPHANHRLVGPIDEMAAHLDANDQLITSNIEIGTRR